MDWQHLQSYGVYCLVLLPIWQYLINRNGAIPCSMLLVAYHSQQYSVPEVRMVLLPHDGCFCMSCD